MYVCCMCSCFILSTLFSAAAHDYFSLGEVPLGYGPPKVSFLLPVFDTLPKTTVLEAISLSFTLFKVKRRANLIFDEMCLVDHKFAITTKRLSNNSGYLFGCATNGMT